MRAHLRRLAIALIGSVLLPSALSVSPAFAIIGGHSTTNQGYVVALTYRAGFGGDAAHREFCSGTLIDRYWVLTAAHCLADGTRRSEYEVVLGRTRLSAAGGEIIRPAQHYIQPGYRGAGNDIALVRLARAASGAPAPVASSSIAALWAPGANLLVMGWGYTCPAEGRWCEGDELKSVLTRVRNDGDCDRAMGGIDRPVEICTKTRGVALGSGDSGGPAVVITSAGPRLVAVSSWGEINGRGRTVVGGWTGYAEVAGTELGAWISATMAAN